MLARAVGAALALRCRMPWEMATQLSASTDAPQDPQIETAPPRVTLRNFFSRPYDSAIAAARTCYSPRSIGPEEITDKQRLTIGAATFYGGHHTVYQHAHFEFGLENVSRQLVWSFLHAHPFYNSEQQSQRYVRLDRAQAYVPPAGKNFGPEERAIYEAAVARAWKYYREITALLQDDARAILADIWHLSSMSHPKRAQRVERQAEKRAIEVARYVLPVAAFTTMVHTLSGIVLHRLWRIQAASDTPTQARQVIGGMGARVREVGPHVFDRCANQPVHAPMMRALQHANYTFGKKISHTADSQDQRHRMVPGSRPLLVLTDTREPDFITPMLIADNPRAREVLNRAMVDAWAAKNALLDRGVPREFAIYLVWPQALLFAQYDPTWKSGLLSCGLGLRLLVYVRRRLATRRMGTHPLDSQS